MNKRNIGVASLVVGAILATVVVGLWAESADTGNEAALPLFWSVLATGLGVYLLRQVERPIFANRRARRVLSTVSLVIAALMASIFIGLLSEESTPFSDAAIPLFLTLVFGGAGLALRGTTASGSFSGNLTLMGLGAVVVPLLLLLFVFATTSEDSEVIDGPLGPAGVDTTTNTVVPDGVLVATVFLIAVGAAAVWFWSRRAVAPMAEITSVANEIQAGSLDRRIGLQGGASEVRELADSFDRMLDRLASASRTQQRMIEDASHELRTPIAALMVNNEVALDAAAPTLEDYRETFERNQALVGRLQTTVDELLAEGRATTYHLEQVDNDLMAIVARVAVQHRLVNPAVPLAVRGPHELRLGIDGTSVERALENLVQNAARYSPPGAPVEIDVIDGDIDALLSVTDHGPGVAFEDLDAIFERYYQNDIDGGTAGIGLALVKQIADAHGGIDVVSPVADGRGTRFTVRFRGGSSASSADGS